MIIEYLRATNNSQLSYYHYGASKNDVHTQACFFIYELGGCQLCTFVDKGGGSQKVCTSFMDAPLCVIVYTWSMNFKICKKSLHFHNEI